MSVPAGGSGRSHANNKAVMLLKCSGARLKCGRIFFPPPLSVHMLTVDHLMVPLIAVAPLPKHHCELMLRWQCFFSEFLPFLSFNLSLHSFAVLSFATVI